MGAKKRDGCRGCGGGVEWCLDGLGAAGARSTALHPYLLSVIMPWLTYGSYHAQVLDLVSSSQQMDLLQTFYETTLTALQARALLREHFSP